MEATQSLLSRSIWHMAQKYAIKTVGSETARKKCITIVPGYNCNTRKRQFRRIARVVAAVAVRPPRVTLEVGREGTEPLEISFFWKTYALFPFMAPPAGGNGNAFGGALSKPPLICGLNLGSIGRSVRDLGHVPWHRPRPSKFVSRLRPCVTWSRKSAGAVLLGWV